MKRSVRNLLAAAALCAAPVVAFSAPPGTSFPYQGRLTDNGAPANGTYDLQIRLFNSSIGGSQQGLTVLLNDQVVSNGVFTADVDFGAEYDGKALWIQIDVRPGASAGAYTPIFPRTKVAATPYAQALNLPVSESGIAPGGLLDFTNQDTTNTAYVLKLTSGGASGNTKTYTYQPVLLCETDEGNGIISEVNSAGGWAMLARSEGSSGTCFVGQNAANGGPAATLDISVATNSSNALDVGTAGTGRAGFFSVTNTNNAANAVEIQTNGNANSQALRCLHSGLGDNSLFEITNAANVGEAVEARTAGTGNAGLFVHSNAASSTPAVEATHNGSSGVGVLGTATGSFSYGVKGTGLKAGVRGECGSTGGAGVWGTTSGGGGDVSTGVRGDGNGAGTSGVAGFCNFGNGIYGQAGGGGSYAGYFSGDVHINGTLSKSSGSFKIDHPLDPANKYLMHSFVEAPDMANIYSGTAVIAEDGTATVKLPDYFEALNIEYRYQLTCVGGYAQVYVAEEVSHNQFKIGGGKPGLKVSWQVTGTRNDAYAKSNRIPTEMEKAPKDKGMYLNPEAFGLDPSLQIGRMFEPRTMKNNAVN